MVPKLLRQSLIFATFTISSMTYMRASMEEIGNEDVSYHQMTYLAFLALFAGICESLEISDHLSPQEVTDTDVSMLASASSQSIEKSALVVSGMAALALPLALTAWAHKLQGDELARSLNLEENFFGLLFSIPALAKFFSVSIPHLLHTLDGTRERFSQSVTNNEIKKGFEKSMPPPKWWVMLAVLVYLHLPEGRLISAPIRDDLLQSLAAFGFSLAESVPHLNQLEQLPQNLAKFLADSNVFSLPTLISRSSAGIIGGLGSASEALMAAFVGTRSNVTAWIAPLIEFVLGFAETQQHLVPSVQKLLQYGMFSPPTKNIDNNVSTPKTKERHSPISLVKEDSLILNSVKSVDKQGKKPLRGKKNKDITDEEMANSAFGQGACRLPRK